MDLPRKRFMGRFAVNTTRISAQAGGKGNSFKTTKSSKAPQPIEFSFGSSLGSEGNSFLLDALDKIEEDHFRKAEKEPDTIHPDGTTLKNSRNQVVSTSKRNTPQRQAKESKRDVKDEDSRHVERTFKTPKFSGKNSKIDFPDAGQKTKPSSLTKKGKKSASTRTMSPPTILPGKPAFLHEESFDINDLSMSMDSPLLVSTPLESRAPVLRSRQENSSLGKSEQSSGVDGAKAGQQLKKNKLFALLSGSEDDESPKGRTSTCKILCVDSQSPELIGAQRNFVKGNPKAGTMHSTTSRGVPSKQGPKDSSGGKVAGKRLRLFTPEQNPVGAKKRRSQECGAKDEVAQKLDFRLGLQDASVPKQVEKAGRPEKETAVPAANKDDSQGFETSHLSKSDMSSIMTTEKKLQLSSWGLPAPVLNKYHEKGITTMFDWQAECLGIPTVLNGGNLVYSAPTSAGKTMVAEILMLKRVLETKKKAIMILPFVSVAREKMIYLQSLFQDAHVKVDGFMGGQSPPGGLASVDIAVCTIEKANGLINRLMEAETLDVLGIIVIDELHMIGDSGRGYLLELLLTKVLYMFKRLQQQPVKDQNDSSMCQNLIQIIGMSATLPNLDLLAKWLQADLYKTDYRPVPLTECVKIGMTVYDTKMKKLRDIDPKMTLKGDDDHVLPLCLETITGGHSVLIFCPTKNWCEKLAETIAREFYQLNKKAYNNNAQGSVKASDLITVQLNHEGLQDVLEQLKRTPVGLDQVLGRIVPFGVAYHHAGLTFDERDIVEGAFRQGMLRVLIATSTLSSGVNLPARRVLIRTPMFHGKVIDILVYKQMVGRAGRKGVDTAGESILICKTTEKAKASTLVQSALKSVQSCLLRKDGLSSSMKRAILEVVVSGVARTPEEVLNYANCTMLACSLTSDADNHQVEPIQACITFLQESELIRIREVQKEGGSSKEFYPTQLGSAILASSLSPDEGLAVFADLQKARRNFVLDSELHVLYQVTPIYVSDMWPDMDWYQYLVMWESLTPSMKRVAELVGVQERFLHKAIGGRIPKKTHSDLRNLAIHLRFYTALVLNNLVQEMPLPMVCEKFKCNRGMLQSLQQSAATFAGMVTVFCNRLGWHNLELLLSQFQSRLTFGVQRDLIDLVRISLLNGFRARALFNAGYQTVAALANAESVQIEQVLRKAVPFQTKKKLEDEQDWEAERRKKSHCIWLTGQKGLTEHQAAIMIINEARDLVQKELGITDIQWQHMQKQKEAKSDSDKEEKASETRTAVIGPRNSPVFSPPGVRPVDSLTGTPLGLTKAYCNKQSVDVPRVTRAAYSVGEASNERMGVPKVKSSRTSVAKTPQKQESSGSEKSCAVGPPVSGKYSEQETIKSAIGNKKQNLENSEKVLEQNKQTSGNPCSVDTMGTSAKDSTFQDRKRAADQETAKIQKEMSTGVTQNESNKGAISSLRNAGKFSSKSILSDVEREVKADEKQLSINLGENRRGEINLGEVNESGANRNVANSVTVTAVVHTPLQPNNRSKSKVSSAAASSSHDKNSNKLKDKEVPVSVSESTQSRTMQESTKVINSSSSKAVIPSSKPAGLSVTNAKSKTEQPVSATSKPSRHSGTAATAWGKTTAHTNSSKSTAGNASTSISKTTGSNHSSKNHVEAPQASSSKTPQRNSTRATDQLAPTRNVQPISPDLYDGSQGFEDSFILDSQTVKLLSSSPLLPQINREETSNNHSEQNLRPPTSSFNPGSKASKHGNDRSKNPKTLNQDGIVEESVVKDSLGLNRNNNSSGKVGKMVSDFGSSKITRLVIASTHSSNRPLRSSRNRASGEASKSGVAKECASSEPTRSGRPEEHSRDNTESAKSVGPVAAGSSTSGNVPQSALGARISEKRVPNSSVTDGVKSAGDKPNTETARSEASPLVPAGLSPDPGDFDDMLNMDSQLQSFMLNYCTQPERRNDPVTPGNKGLPASSDKITPVAEAAENIDLNYFASEDMFADMSPQAELKNLIQNCENENPSKRLSPDKLESFDSEGSFKLHASFTESPELLPASLYDRDADASFPVPEGTPIHASRRNTGQVLEKIADAQPTQNQIDLKGLLGGIDFSDSLSGGQTFKSPAMLPRPRKSSTPVVGGGQGSNDVSPGLGALSTQLQRDIAFAEQLQDSVLSITGENICDTKATSDNLNNGAKHQTETDHNSGLSVGALALLDEMAGPSSLKLKRKPPPKSQRQSGTTKRKSSFKKPTPTKCRKNEKNASLNSNGAHDESSDFIPATPPKDTPKGKNMSRSRNTPKSASRTQKSKSNSNTSLKKGSRSGLNFSKPSANVTALSTVGESSGKCTNNGSTCKFKSSTSNIEKTSESSVKNSKVPGIAKSGGRAVLEANSKVSKASEGLEPENRIGPSTSHKEKNSNSPVQEPFDSQADVTTGMDNAIIMDLSASLLDADDSPISSTKSRMPNDSLLPSFRQCSQPNDDEIPATDASFTIIDVAANKKLFKTFLSELKTKRWFAVSLACDDIKVKKPTQAGSGIGAKFTKKKTKQKPHEENPIDGIKMGESEQAIVGMSFCWENRDAYYVPFTQKNQSCDLDESLAPPPIAEDLPVSYRLQSLRTVLESISKRGTQAAFDLKEQYRCLSHYCGIILPGSFEDPKVACWMIDPGAKEKNLHGMVTNYLPLETFLLEGIGGGFGLSSIGLTTQNPGSGRVRSAVEVVLVQKLMEYFRKKLNDEGLHQAFKDIEMPSVVCLSRLELNGLGFSQEECDSQRTIMQVKLTALEEQAYSLARHPFSLSSPEDVGQVLFVELQLPPTGDPDVPYKPPNKGKGARGKQQFSTSKDILQKLKLMHPLPGLILEWRRITNAMTKVIYPLQKEKVYSTVLEMERIYGYCQTFTATGRVSMAEPNLQNVPKDFEIEMPGETPQDPLDGRQRSVVGNRPQAPIFSVSMRHAFIPFKDGVLLAADYSQLELRMIAHLSQDKKLIEILNEGGDVFKQITAKWKNKSVEDVTPVERQQAKQVCYGMVYGIGAKALGEQLEVDENEAATFIDSFKAKYTGMRAYLKETIQKCREFGYVKTILGRRRYLPGIRDSNVHVRSHAERQAVNTTVQGSAADLVKKAMVKIDDQLQRAFPSTVHAHRHRFSTDLEAQTTRRQSQRILKGQHSVDGAYLVLQLHDELMYEVHEHHVKKVARIIKNCMETALDMSVKFPVKLKVGPTWGSLEDFEI